MINDWVYDIETFPNVFTCSFEHADAPITLSYEISPWRNDSKELMIFLNHLRETNARMIGFNNIGFDYPVIHQFMKMGQSDANLLYQKAMAIIKTQSDEGDDRWTHQVYSGDRFIEQIDLFKIRHFDNKARATSLKSIEFAMKSDSIEDLPFPVGAELTREQAEVLKRYNAHDVSQTKKFFHKTKDMIAFREELTRKYDRDFMNHNDTKIGKDYFIMKLEEAGIACYTYGPDGRKPRQTKRPVINLKDAILPWIEFENPELKRVLEWLKCQTITETKGVFKDLTATIDGFTLVFGLGGIHGSVENKVIVSDDKYAVIDIDVEAYYPSTAIAQRFKPAHYPDKFCDIYADIKEQRKRYKKGTPENAMLKLALNGVYGDSNNQFSVFYDPLMTMSITLNGQLLLCVLIENLLKYIPGIELIQANTDGLTVRVARNDITHFHDVVGWWESVTKLKMEESFYSHMFIRDVNSYIAVYTDGKRKLKGAYAHSLEWHQDHSALVVQKVAEKHLVEGAHIRETIQNWPDIMDFMLRGKVPRSSYLTVEHDGQTTQLQNTIRFYIAEGGGHLFKWMPPLKGKSEWRRIGMESGWGVQVCSDIKDAGKLPIDYEYYIREVEKLCLQLR